MKSLIANKRIKAVLIVLLCVIAVVASIYTSGLTRALIELSAFASLIWLVLSKPYIEEG
ncbi:MULTISPECIES: hypothetical protein [Shewanella]|uniref:hypothetical protein n=1 Tax=Shewanella TaxID=22 RepID=UPI0013EE703B|nr:MULTISPECIES: hypothetical protein [Shewanella]